jgi:hypothetical protein
LFELFFFGFVLHEDYGIFEKPLLKDFVYDLNSFNSIDLVEKFIIYQRGNSAGLFIVSENINKYLSDELTNSRHRKLEAIHVIRQDKWMLNLSESMNGDFVLNKIEFTSATKATAPLFL